jgi:hypothetical protein
MKALNFIFKLVGAISGITLIIMLINFVFDWVYQTIGLAGIVGVGAVASVGYAATISTEERAEVEARCKKALDELEAIKEKKAKK